MYARMRNQFKGATGASIASKTGIQTIIISLYNYYLVDYSKEKTAPTEMIKKNFRLDARGIATKCYTKGTPYFIKSPVAAQW